MASVHQEARLADIAKLMVTEAYSDLTIVCAGQEFKVHKAIMCSASTVMAAECDNDMREKKSGIITYQVGSVDRIEATPADCEAPGSDSSVPPETLDSEATAPCDVNRKLMAHARVFGIGAYYDIPRLRTIAAEKFDRAAAAGWEISDLIDVVKEVHIRSCPSQPELRNVLRRHALARVEELTKDNGFMTQLAEMEEVQDFAADMLRSIVASHNEERSSTGRLVRSIRGELDAAHRQVDQLQDALVDQKRLREASEERGEDIVKQAREAIADIEETFKRLPSECRNVQWEREFGGLRFEWKGSRTPGGLLPDFWIKCGK
ncbi:hypothetical protein LTR53_011410 [Teratosphaeriaceae sp. CCFEE 6253]|nr:hypothetical protein LTR53_011410 [Teratosphaeriaceae sp. CCFEE 6253]